MEVEEWTAASFDATLRGRERALVLFDADWCPFATSFRALFEAAEPEAVVPLARTRLRRARDVRWDKYRIEVVPTLIYFEHGEELERMDGSLGCELTRRDLEEFLGSVAAIQEEPVLPRHMHGPRRS